MIELINDDCRKIIKNLPKDKNYCIVTDPPFNVSYHYNLYKDNLDEKEYFEWLADIFSGFPLVVIHYPEALYKLSHYLGLFPEKVVSWVYNSNTARQHRDIAFFNIKPDFNKVHQPYKNLNDSRIQKRISEGKNGAKLYDWWNINQIKNVNCEKTKHPCQMPLDVMKNIIGVLPESYIYRSIYGFRNNRSCLQRT